MKKLSLLLSVFTLGATFTLKAQEAEKKANAYLGALNDFRFEQNVGQIKHDGTDAFASEVQFMLKNGNHKIFLMNNGLSHQFEQLIYPEGYDPMERDPEKMEAQEALRTQIQFKTYRMDMQLLGANAHPKITKEGKSAYPKRYYKGQTFTAWSWEKVTYHDVYPGIDWVLYTRGNEMKYDFVVHPGADPSMIQLKVLEADEASIQNDGGFRWSNPMGWVNEHKPLSLQNGLEVESRYHYEDGVLQFEIGAYDRSRVLCIDPVIQWGTYFGGSFADNSRSVVIDSSNYVYIAGYTRSSGIATIGASYAGGDYDAFIAKFDSNGVLKWSTYYGGANKDEIWDMALDGSGNVYVTGNTSSTAGIATTGAHDETFSASPADIFLAKFDSSGSRQWGTYIGGSGDNNARSIAIDASNDIYVTGATSSSDFVTKSLGTLDSIHGGGYDVFLTKFNSGGTLMWNTLYGGLANETAYGMAIDSSENVLLTGETNSSNDIATSGTHQTSIGGATDAFIAKFKSNGVLQWGTYFGGTSNDGAYSIVTDDKDNIYIGGYSESSTSIGTAGTHQTSIVGVKDAMIAMFNSSGVRQWGTYYGGFGSEEISGIDIDSSGNIYVTGKTTSLSGISTTSNYVGTQDAFIAVFDSIGKRQFATYYGGSSSDEATAIALDNPSYIYITGFTSSADSIATLGAHQTSLNSSTMAFLAKFEALPPAPEITKDPLNQTKCEGDTAYFTCSVTGTFDSLQWQQYSSSWSRIKGGLDTFYRIDSTTALMNGDSIRVIAYGPGGNDTSGAAVIQLRGFRPTVATNAITQPTSGQANGSVDLTISGYGSYLRYSKWGTKAGNPYPEGADFDLSNAAEGIYYFMIVTKQGCVYYEGPFNLGPPR